MLRFYCTLLFILVSVLGVCIGRSVADEESASAQTAGVENDPQRETVLKSARWSKAQSKFKKWLSVQTVYTDAEVEALQREFKKKVDSMTAAELQDLLEEMEEKLDVLLSPAISDARSWVNRYYTKEAQKQLAKKYGAEDPLSLSADEIDEIVVDFYSSRQSQLADKAAFDRSRQSQSDATRRYAASQQRARTQAAQHAPSRSAPSSTAYAPRKNKSPQVYRAPYPKGNYSIGPWGGVWLHR